MRLHHLGWVVRDLRLALRQFEREGAYPITEPIEDPIQRVTVQFLVDSDSPVLWELVAPLGSIAESPLASRLLRGGGLDHACYELDRADGSLETVIEREGGRRSRIICPPTYSTAFRRNIAFVIRPSGRIVEFVERNGTAEIV